MSNNIWYIDYEEGNNSWSGDSYSVTVSGTNGVTNGTSTFTSVGAGFTSSLIGRYINILGRGFYLVTATPNTTTLTLSVIPGSNIGSPAGGTNLTYFIGGRWSRATNLGAAARPVQNGDTVRFKSCEPPVLIDNATWTQGASAITFNSTVSQIIDNCDSGWTAAANVTRTHTAGGKDYTGYVQLDIGAAFTTGIVAYKTLPSTLNLSNYNVLSFWHSMGTTVLAASAFRVNLCSDSIGAVPVATFDLPNTIANVANTAIPFALSSSSPLPSNVNSISIFAVSDPGAVTLRFDHFIACLSSGPNLQHFLGKYDSNPHDHWWGIRTLSGSIATIECVSNSLANFGSTVPPSVYPFTTENVPTYFVNPIRTAGSNSGGDGRFGGIGWTPVPNNNVPEIDPERRLTFSGGWSRDDMSTKVFKTFLDGLDGNGQMLNLGQNITIEDFIVSRFFSGISLGTGGVAENCDAYLHGGNSGLLASNTSKNIFTNCKISSSVMQVVGGQGVSATNISFDNSGNSFRLLQLNTSSEGTYNNLNFFYAGNTTNTFCLDITQAFNNQLFNVNTTNCSKVFSNDRPGDSGTVIYNLSSNVEQTVANYSGNASAFGHYGSNIVQGYNGDANDIRTYGNRWTVQSERTIRNQTQGLAWRATTSQFTAQPLWLPIRYKIATVGARANTPIKVNASIYCTKTQAQGLSAGLMCIDDVAVNIVETRSYVNNTSALTYIPVTWTFTPTVDAVIPVYFFATLPSNTDYAIIDSVSVQ